MNMIKRVICILSVSAVILSMAGCAGKKENPANVNFTDLKLGISLQEMEDALGENYTLQGSTPDRATYVGLKPFDFLGKDENTKLNVFLNTEDNVYAYAFYMYDAVDGNYAKLKEYLTGLYGEPVQGENASEQWTDGDITYSVNNQGDYVAVGKF